MGHSPVGRHEPTAHPGHLDRIHAVGEFHRVDIGIRDRHFLCESPRGTRLESETQLVLTEVLVADAALVIVAAGEIDRDCDCITFLDAIDVLANIDDCPGRLVSENMPQGRFVIEPVSITDPAVLVAAALGMFLGLEREWSNKTAGIRTFRLRSLVGAAATTVGEPVLVAIGDVLVRLQDTLLGVRGLVATASESTTDTGLSLTTSTSLLMAYAVGILVASGHLLLSVVISITSSSLLVLRRELHGFANQLSREEVHSAAEFAIIAFVVYPLLPNGTCGPWNVINPPLVWTLVIVVSGIGFVNYALMQRYGGHGVMLTGFLGGLALSLYDRN